MAHLGTLRVVNLVFAVVVALIGLLFLALWGIGGLLAIRDGEPMGWVFLLGGIVVGALLGGLSVLHGRVARSVPLGRGRIAQTALATLHLLSFPVGTVYALYALWVCWVNSSTKTKFDLHDRL
jgi:hypothetical protein